MHRNISKLVLSALLVSATATAAKAGSCGTTQQCFGSLSGSGYGIIAVGDSNSATHETVNINSGPINANVLLGGGVVTSSSGGNNGQIVGTIYTDGTATGDLFSHVQIPTAPVATVSTTVTANMLAAANSVSDWAAALSPTSTFAALTGTQSFTGSGGLNVYDVTGNYQNVALTLTGGANDYFVFNIGGNLQTNLAMTLNGVDTNHILFNLLGTSGNILQTSGGDVLDGIFLATHGGNFQFSELNLTGQLINTAGLNAAGGIRNDSGSMQIVSGSRMLFSVIQPVPEPSTWALMLLGFGAVGAAMRYRRRPAAFAFK
jgi:PEP-CTERM motif